MQSVLDYLNEIKGEGGFVKDSKAVLPELIGNSEANHWVPGAFEGILLRSNVNMNKPFFVNYALFLKTKRAIDSGREKAKNNLCDSLMKYSAITITDPILANMKNRVNKEKTLSFARDLFKTTVRAEIAKFAIGLLGEYGTEEDLPDLILISSHEEFTLFGCVALKNILNRAGKPYNGTILSLCGHTFGWGKIAAVRELDFTLPETRDYLLSSGCRNDIALSHLSNVCAIKGKLLSYLKKALSEEAEFDEAHLYGICDIWEGFCDKDHPENDSITDYPDYAEAFELFRQVVEKYGYSNNERVIKVIKAVMPEA